MADKPFLSLTGLSEVWAAIKSKFQEKLVSGTNIKTINNSSILGSGNINITSGVSGVKGDAESSYRTGLVNLTAANVSAVPLHTAAGIKTCSGNGENWYYILATITITSAYVNRPLVFEISGRGTNISWVQVMFQTVNSTDPGLLSFYTNNSNEYYIKKTSTSNWTIYGKYNEVWGHSALHRITGAGADIGVSVKMENFGMDAPTDVQRATYFGNVAYANSAGTATDSTKLPLAGGTLTGRLTTSKPINQILTGTGTAGSDKGSGVSPRYFPARWTFDAQFTPSNGDVVNIKIPVAGYSKGIWLSTDNGTTYYPVAVNGTTRLQDQYPVGICISLIFESSGTTTIYALNGSDASSTVTGGCWRVINYYDGILDVLLNGSSVVNNNVAYITIPNFHISSSDPTSSDGINGDIWFKYE